MVNPLQLITIPEGDDMFVEMPGRLLRLLSCAALFALAGCHSAPPPSSEELEKACAAGNAESCQKAVRALDEQCYRKDAPACTRAATLYLSARLGSIDKVKAVADYERGCDAGDAKACNSAGEAYMKKDMPKAERYRLKSCDLGNGDGCFYAAADAKTHDDEKGFKDKADAFSKRAEALYKKACDAADPVGCYGLGNIYRVDDEQKAVPFFRGAMTIWQKRCDG